MATALRIECDRMSITAELERTCTARIALLELAAECDIDRTGTDDELRNRIAMWILTAGSRIRGLEGTNHVLLVHRIPNLEGQVRELALDRAGWSDRALASEKSLRHVNLLFIGAVVTAGAAIAFIAHLLHRSIG